MALVQSFKATALTSEAPTPLPVAGFKMLDSQVAGHLQLRSKPCEFDLMVYFEFCKILFKTLLIHLSI